MRELGIEYVRIGEFAWSRYEPRRGDFVGAGSTRRSTRSASAGLKIVLGTPTATPPKWLMDEFPEIAPIDKQGRPRGFGSRRHYTFSSRAYWHESARIVEALAALWRPSGPRRVADRQRVRLPRHRALVGRRGSEGVPRLASKRVPISRTVERSLGVGRSGRWRSRASTRCRSRISP